MPNGCRGSGKLDDALGKQPRTVLLHDTEELDDDLRARPDHHLPLARLLCIVDALESVVEDRSSHHFEGFRVG